MSPNATVTADPVTRNGGLLCRCGHLPTSHGTRCQLAPCPCERAYREAYRVSRRPVVASYVAASGQRRWSVRRTRAERVGLAFATFTEALIYVRLGCPPMGSGTYQSWRAAYS